MPSRRPIPTLIRTPRLTLRGWEPCDARPMVKAIGESLEHLRPWMPWAVHEPQPVEEKVKLILSWRESLNRGHDLLYAVYSQDESRFLGGIGAHGRIGTGAREIGYWVHVDHVRQGYATEAAATLVRIAFELEGMRRIEIHCDPRNIASASVPRKLGFAHQVTIRNCVKDASIAPRDTMIWSLTAGQYDRSPARLMAIELFDMLGAKIEIGTRN